MSHEEQTDLRVRRTHHLLQEAMIELITEKGFDSITVGDIARRAMINRATFYRHYQDKYDLVAGIFEETANRLADNMTPIIKDHNKKGIADTTEIWVELFTHIGEHARLYRAMLGKNGSPWFANRMREHTIKLIAENKRLFKQQYYAVQKRQAGIGQEQQPEETWQIDPTIPEELPAVQLSYVLIGTIIWWLESDTDYTPRQVAIWFFRFVCPGYLGAFGYQEPSKSSDPGSTERVEAITNR